MKNSGYIARVLDIESIKSRRESLGLSQEAAAKLAGFASRQHWYAIETGAAGGKSGVTLGTLSAIAMALNCDAKDLLSTPPKRRR